MGFRSGLDDYEYGLYEADGSLFDQIARRPETVFLDGHLRANGGTGRFNGKRIGRALSGVSFGGIAFVDRPANKRSFILNHFAFDPTPVLEEVGATSDDLSQDQVVTQTTLFSNEKPMEVNMNDLNRAAASNEEQIAKGVEKAFESRERVEAQKRTKADLDSAQARNADLEKQLAEAKSTLERLQIVHVSLLWSILCSPSRREALSMLREANNFLCIANPLVFESI